VELQLLISPTRCLRPAGLPAYFDRKTFSGKRPVFAGSFLALPRSTRRTISVGTARRANELAVLLQYLENGSMERDALSKHAAVVLEHQDNRSKHRDDVSLQPARRKRHSAVGSEHRDDGSKSRDVASFRRASVSV
jgi:hypothetical protein